MPVTFVGKSTFAARNPLTSAEALARINPSTTEEFALDVPDGVEASVGINELATIWHTLEHTWPASDTRPWQTGETVAGRPVLAAEGTFIRGLPDDLRQQVLDAKKSLFPPLGSTPEEGVEAYYAPRSISARQGLGVASVNDVQLGLHPEPVTPDQSAPAPATQDQATAQDQTSPAPQDATAQTSDPAPATSTAPDPATRALFDDAIAKVQKELPGVLTPGTNTYKSGLYEGIGLLTSSLGTRTGVRRFFSAGQTNAPVRLGRISEVTTSKAGAVVVDVELIARPAKRYRDGTAQMTELYGHPSQGGADIETHTMSGATELTGHSTTSLDWATRLTATLNARPTQSSSLRTTGATAAFDAFRQHAKGQEHRDQQVHRPITKSAGNVVRVHVPMELAIRVTVTSQKDWLPMRIVPATFVGLSSLWTKGRALVGFPVAEPDTTWHDASVTLEFMKGDGTTRPLTAEPPPNTDRPSTLFLPRTTSTPDAIQVSRAPDGQQSVPARDGQPHFDDAEIASWEPFDGLNERVGRVGLRVLPDLRLDVLDVDRHGAGLQLLRRAVAGVQHR
ncbi:hypothetical protein [Catenuloplanes japonicus]|uniref:hypothetical protein n=1 Tax=Catenuloplanes japonicus TaxID=33876 RepID=UPI0018DB3CBC|nr:hypothetical protein [Catenuloplanes japonicus]